MKQREDELLESLMAFYTPHNRVIVGPGYDAAVISEMPTLGIVLSIDAQTEGVHFRRSYLSLEEIGHRSLAAALSDLAPMGATPLTYLVNLEIPQDIERKDVLHIYEGFKDLSSEFCISPVGGNVVQGTRISLVTTVVGEIPKDRSILRSQAKPGDLVAVTGDFGKVFAALEIIKRPERFALISADEREKLLEKFRRPKPRIKEMLNMINLVHIHSAIDISDGLGIDLGRIARASDVEIHIRVEDLPISNEVERVAREIDIPPWRLALASGEEFELAFTFSKDEKREIEKSPFPVKVVGVVKEGFVPDVIAETGNGESVSVVDLGYDQILGWKTE